MEPVGRSGVAPGAGSAEWRKGLLPVDATIHDAIRNLDDSALQIVMLVTEGDRLVGTITDGDIRRGLLRGLEMSSPVSSIVQRDPLVVPQEWSGEMAIQLMRVNKIHQLPVVNERRCVVGLHLWDELLLPTKRPNTVVIMAGGYGTRLLPRTEECPKPLLPVAGKPMMEHIVERARAVGFDRFVVAVHYLGHRIEEYFGDGSRWQVQIEYLHEETPLGTAGAIRRLDPRPEIPFLVTNADVLTDLHYGELVDFHVRHGATATMAVRRHVWQHPFGVVHTKGVDITDFEEKPIARSNVNAGVYVLDPSAIDCLADGERCDMPTLFRLIMQRGGRSIVFPVHEQWLDVGLTENFERANGGGDGSGSDL